MRETTKQPSFARHMVSVSSRKFMSASKRSLSRLFPKHPACVSTSGLMTTSDRSEEEVECRDVWEAAETNRLSSWKASLFGSGRILGANLSFRRSFRDDSQDRKSERLKSFRSASESSKGPSSARSKDESLETVPETPAEKVQQVEAQTLLTDTDGLKKESDSHVHAGNDADNVSASKDEHMGESVADALEETREHGGRCEVQEKPAGDDGSSKVELGKDQAGEEQEVTTRGWKSQLHGVLNVAIPGSSGRQLNEGSLTYALGDDEEEEGEEEETPTTPVGPIRSTYSGPIVRQVRRHEVGGRPTATLPRVRSSDCEDGKYLRKPTRSVTSTPRSMVPGYRSRSPNIQSLAIPSNAGFSPPQARRGPGFNSPSGKATRATRPEFCRSVTSEQLSSRPTRASTGQKSPLGHTRRLSGDFSSPLYPTAEELTFPLHARGKVGAVAYLGQMVEERKYPAAVSDSWAKSRSTGYASFPELIHTDSQ